MALTLRSSRSSNLTATEVDNNFLELSGSIADIVDGTTPAASASYALTASYALNGGGGGGLTIKNPTDGNSTSNTTGFSGIESLNFMQPITLSYNDTTASISIPNVGSSVYENGAYVTFTKRLNFIGATITDGDSFTSIEYAGGGAGDLSAVASDILPEFDSVYDLGASDKKWFDGYFTNQVSIGTGSISDDDGDLAVDTNLIVQGILSANAADLGNITISGSTISALSFGNPYADIDDTNTLTVEGGLEVIGNTVLSYPSSSLYVGVWTYGESLNTGRAGAGGDGTQHSAITAGGNGPGNAILSTEEYNGLTWYYGGTFGNGNNHSLIGNSGNAQAIGNSTGALTTKTYNGLVWATDTYGTIFPWDGMAVAGTPSNGITAGGRSGVTYQVTGDVQIDNGSAWVRGANIPGAVSGGTLAGTQTATIAAGGVGAFNIISGESYTHDGTAWTALPNLLVSVYVSQMNGTPDQAILHGGTANVFTGDGERSISQFKTQIWDGIAWSFGTNTLVNTYGAGSGGSTSSTISFGGSIQNASSVDLSIATTQLYNTTTVGIPVMSYSAENGFIVLSQVSQSLDFADDAAAAAGDVPLGGLYHSSGAIKIRLV